MKTHQTIKARIARKARQKALPNKAVICTVYALVDADNQIRYVGQTRNDVKSRFKYHMKDAFNKGRSPVHKWVAAGQCAGFITLQKNAVWLISEAIWIRTIRKAGGDLLNTSNEHDHIYMALDHNYSIPNHFPTGEGVMSMLNKTPHTLEAV